MGAFHIKDVGNMATTTSRSGPSSRSKDVTVDMLMTYEDDKFIMEAEEVRPERIEMQRMTKWGLQVLQDTTMDRRMEAIVETRVVSLFENSNQDAAKSKKPCWPSFWKGLTPSPHSDAVNETFLIMVQIFAELQDFV